MASNLVFADSADHYDRQSPGNPPDFISKKWTQNFGNGSNSTPNGRNGRGIDLGTAGGVGKTVGYTDKCCVGWAVNFNGNQGFDSNPLYTWSSANTNPLGVLRMVSDGTLSLYAGNSLNLIVNSGTAGFTLKGQVFYYFEVKSQVFAGGMGDMSITMTLYVNGTLIMTGSGDVGFNESQTINKIAEGNYHLFQGAAHSSNTIIDDVYICDLHGGGIISDHLGDVAIGVVFPASDATAQWAAVGGSTSTNFDHVNATFPETNINAGIYIKDNTMGDVSNWNWQHIAPFTGQLLGVHYGLYSQKDGESTRSIQQSTQGTPNGPIIYPSDEGRYDFFGMDADPSTGIQWTQAGFNASTFGVTLNS